MPIACFSRILLRRTRRALWRGLIRQSLWRSLLPVLQFCPILRETNFGWVLDPVTSLRHIVARTGSPQPTLSDRAHGASSRIG
jgi:hypothetical protein